MQWIQINENGFAYSSSNVTRALFTGAGRSIWAKTELGLFVMDGPPEQKVWASVPLPDTIDLSQDYFCRPIGVYLYLSLKNNLYFKEMESLASGQWKKVLGSTILPPNETVIPIPIGFFNGQIYGYYYSQVEQDWLFSICRSIDLGKTEMQWELVAPACFGQAKVTTPAFMLGGKIKVSAGSYRDRVWIGINTLPGGMAFGDPNAYRFSDGVEIWESSTGDLHSWSRVNEPGFGTLTVDPQFADNPFHTNQTIESAAIAHDPSTDQQFLVVGTATHFAPVPNSGATTCMGSVIQVWGGI